ncbi:DUF4230 domain-containing protein [Euhalothece natronophila Z-M001]|uniref:DUF4230 domain-containing protein n=1 Tax=Euhalothece natronophila Z-M001 TaxID=522448 RepID=A0A5B8NPW0_9CHRO|nr:DUF4230 domain-containing protein [Euhalothece natronophila]QDZ40239.1 DUF4230 domain-containing protein [Euhalothece natronophila Z-M001]
MIETKEHSPSLISDRNDESNLNPQQPITPPTRQSHPAVSFLKILVLLSLGGIGMVTLLILYSIWRTGDRAFTLVENFLTAPPPEPEVSVPTMIVSQVQEVSELTTSVFTMESIVPTQQDRKVGNLTVGTTRLLYIAQGEVRAGVDLSQMSTDDVVVNEDSVTVTLPPAKILDHKLDVSESKVYDYDRGFLNLGPDVAPELQTLAQQKTLDKVVTAACEEGILDQARDRAEITVTELLKASSKNHEAYSNIQVVSESSPSSTCTVK